MFSGIQLRHWRQFNEVSIELDTRMTVLTGENGAGKTTILNVLSRHFGWNLQLISTPLPISKRRANQLWSDVWDMLRSDLTVQPQSTEVGTIRYRNGEECRLMAPQRADQAQYSLSYSGQQQVLGLHIPSHRPSFAYHRITSIPTDPKTSQQQYQQYQDILLQLYQSERSQNPGSTLKQSLISLAVFGHGSEAVAENPEYRRMFQEFQHVLSILLPPVIGFKRLEIRMPDIVLITESGDFSLDAASGGVGAIVGMAWQIFMYGQDNDEFVVTIDEPESHLHPSMQRELLPNLFKAFPKTQFIVATHSPFIVTSSTQSQVYVLVFNEQRRVDSSHLETAELSGTANETLREILGVPISVPIWVEERLKQIVDKYEYRELTTNLLQELKKELISNDLGFLLPDAVSRLGRADA